MLEGVERERLEVRGGEIELSLLDWGGSGPPALLHHANGFCAALWAPVAEKLRQSFRVFAMDARGHGDSDKPAAEPENYHWGQFGADALAVAELLVERHGPLALGLGHSFGGTCLAMAAIDGPGLFERLMLLDPIIPPSDPVLRARVSRGNVLAEGARRRRDVWSSRAEAREKWAAKDLFAHWEPAALDLYVEHGLRERSDGSFELECPREVEAAIFESNASVDVMSLLPRLETPVCLVHASDGNFPLEHFERIAGSMQRAVLVEAPTGHFVPMQDPGWVVREALATQVSVG